MQINLSIDTSTDDVEEVRAIVDHLFGDAPADTVDIADPEAIKKAAAAAKRKEAAAKKKAEAAEAAEAAKSGPKLEDVRKALKGYAALEDKDAAIKILKDHDAASIGELDEEKFQSVIDACG